MSRIIVRSETFQTTRVQLDQETIEPLLSLYIYSIFFCV